MYENPYLAAGKNPYLKSAEMPLLGQEQSPTILERGKKAVSDFFRPSFAPERTVPVGMEGMPESTIPAGMEMDIPGRRDEISKRLGRQGSNVQEQLYPGEDTYFKDNPYVTGMAEAQELTDELQDLRQQEYGAEMARPISTITGKPIPTPEERMLGGITEPGKYDFMDRALEIKEEGVVPFIPFVSGAKEVKDIAKVSAAAYKLKKGTATSEEKADLVEFLEKANRDTTFGYKVLDTVVAMPAFMGEFLLTSGLYTAGRKVGTKAATKTLKNYMGKTGRKLLEKDLGKIGIAVAGGIAGGTLQAPIMGAPRIVSGTIERSMPKLKLTADEQNNIDTVISGEGEEFLVAATKALGDQWAETVSEHSGGLFRMLNGSAKNAAIRAGLFSAVMKANTGMSPNKVNILFNKMAYHGVINEMLEERVGEGLRTGLGLQEYKIPTPEQLAVELVSFSVPGVIQSLGAKAFGEKLNVGLDTTENKERYKYIQKAALDRFRKGSVEDLVSLRKSPEGTEYAKELDQVIGEKGIAEERGLIPREEIGPKALPPGQGFDLIPPKPKTKLRPSPEKIKGPTYPEGAEYVAGKPAPEGLEVGHKPVLTIEEKPFKKKENALRALKSKRLASKSITSETHEVVSVKGGFGITKKVVKPTIKKPAESKLDLDTRRLTDSSGKDIDIKVGMHVKVNDSTTGIIEGFEAGVVLFRTDPINEAERAGKARPIQKINDSNVFDIIEKSSVIKETKLKAVSKKVKAETPTMLKESDKVNDVTLGTLVDMAAEDPAKALEHAAEATVSKAKLIEGLKNKGLKAMGEAKTKEERTEIKRNLEETLRGIEEGKKNEATNLYEKNEVPKGSFVHGRYGRQDLDTGTVILATNDWNVADSYAEQEGSKWLIRPTKNSKILEADKEFDKIADVLFKDFKDGQLDKELEDMVELAIDEHGESAAKEKIGSEIVPENIVDTAAMWDSPAFVEWTRNKFEYDIAIWNEGEAAAIINPEGVFTQKVKEDVSAEPAKEPVAEAPAKEPWELDASEWEKALDVEHGTIKEDVAAKIKEEGLKLSPPRIPEGETRPAVDMPDSAFFLPLGSSQTKIMYSEILQGKINPKARSLEEGTLTFKELVKGIKNPETSGMGEVLFRAKEAGFDIVKFKRQDTGWVALTDNAVNFKSHKQLIKEALKSGKLTPEKYAELHEKDYGPLEAFMPEVVKKPEPEVAAKVKKESLSETKSRLLENIKSEKGSSELINDLSRLGADAIKRGHKSFKAFSVEMKTVLGDAWAKVKHLIGRAYKAARKTIATVKRWNEKPDTWEIYDKKNGEVVDILKPGENKIDHADIDILLGIDKRWGIRKAKRISVEMLPRIIKSERGAIDIGKHGAKLEEKDHPTLTPGAQKLLGELEELKKEHEPSPLPPEEAGTPEGKSVGAYNDLAARLRTRTVDRLYPLMYKLDKGLDITDPDAQAYIQGRMDTSAPTVVATFLQHGKLKWLQNAPYIETKDEGFLPLTEKHGTNEKKVDSYDADTQTLLKDKIGYKPKSIRDIDRYLFWKIATRAEKLMGENREHLFTKKDIALLKEIGAKDWKNTDLNKEYVAFNKNILDFAQEIGLIDPAMRKTWEHDEYIPFYRILEDELLGEEFLRVPVKSRKFIDSQIKKLVGGTDKLGDPFENILRNWSHLITESIRNRSRTTAFKYMQKLGHATPSKPPKYIGKPEKEAILSYMENGKRKYFKIHDLELFNALSGANIEKFDGLLMKMFGTSKRMLTYGATFGPAFRVANFMRDTLQTAMVNKSFIPVWDSMRGLYKAYTESPDAIAMMSGGGGFSLGYVRGDDPKAMARHVRKIVRKAHKKGFTLSPLSLLEWWEKIGSASENAARVQLYANWRKKGASHLVAGFKARDVLDFSLSGDAQITQLMVRTMPFLGARMQGLYKMGRAYGENPGAFLLKGAILAGLSLAWWSGVKDDDRYKELEDWEKWTYRHFWIGDVHFRLPRAFEVDAIFSSSVESIADVLSENEEGKHIMHFIGQTMRDTFALDVPQLAKPLYEQAVGKIGFTGRPILSESMKRVSPENQKQPWTSESLQILGEKLHISPLRAEALVRGYLATLGMFILGGADVLSQWMFDFPTPPKKRVDDYPLIGRFVRETPPRHTKYMTRFYEMTREMDVLVGDINNYKKTGDIEKAVELARTSRDTLQYKKGVNRIRKRIGLINGRIKMIHYRKDLTSEQKKEKINKLLDYRNKILENAYIVMTKKEIAREVSP